MVKIFFLNTTTVDPVQDEALRLLATPHVWIPDGEDYTYGVCIPHHFADPNEVADRLSALGVIVLPGANDDTQPDPKIAKTLAKYGVNSGDKGRDVAKKMHTASGMSHLKPHLY